MNQPETGGDAFYDAGNTRIAFASDPTVAGGVEYSREVTSPRDQSQYQVRFDWGVEGAADIAANVDVVIVVDALLSTLPVAGSSIETSGSLVAVDARPLDSGAAIIVADFRSRTAAAEWVLARQAERGTRVSVAVVAAGTTRDDDSLGFAVEDLLAAGAVVDALAAVGIDYCSPEAAAASAAFTGLRGATAHLVSASASGKQLAAEGQERGLAAEAAAHIARAVSLDADSQVVVVREWPPASEGLTP